VIKLITKITAPCVLVVLVIYFFILNCSSEQLYDGSLWTEAALAVIGGTLLATEGNISLVQNMKSNEFSDFFIKTAFANSCVTLNNQQGLMECDNDGRLKILYNNCTFPDISSTYRGYWRAYHRLDFENKTVCENIRTTAITFEDNSLKDKTITRHFGLTISDDPSGSGDENTNRVGADNKISRFYTFLPSGWYDDSVRGGIEVTFRKNGSIYSRELKIKGFHLSTYEVDENIFKQSSGASYSELKNGASFNLEKLVFYTDTIYAALVGDQTVDTKTLQVSGSGSSEEDLWESPSSDYTPIVVTGTGANKTITAMKFRIQHNISEVVVVGKLLPEELKSRFQSEGVSLDTTPISWVNDESCCWPTQGEFLTNYYHIDNMKYEFRSTLTRFTSDCGVVEIRYFDELNARKPLNNNSPRRHTLTQCF